MRQPRSSTLKHLIYTIALLMGISACSSPMKMLEKGNYDQAIGLAIRKLSGKDKKKVKYVQALEEAFAKATAKDMRLAEQYRLNGSPEALNKAFDIFRKIKQRQAQLEPLLPLVDEQGIKADFSFVRVNPLLEETREAVAQAYYDRALHQLEQAEFGDRSLARAAFEDLEQIEKYFASYKNSRQLINKAKRLGTAHILIALDEYSSSGMPYEVQQEVLRLNLPRINDEWQQFYTYEPNGVELDYKVIVHLNNWQVSPSLVDRREFTETREIESGFEYVLDEKGNVKKDSLGNDIKVPKKVLVEANVVETFQNKTATMDGRLEFIDLRNQRVIDTDRIRGKAIFENIFVVFKGDERALSEETQKRLHLSFIPFPTDAALLYDIVEKLRPEIERKIDHNNKIL